MAVDPEARIRAAVKQREKANEEFDASIRAGVEAKLSPTVIARASGLSRTHVYRILNG